ncbi:hypothetical protein [Meiothermus cerbereus]|uniref:hypothetical protein n=1 Tax=Meiothermus cerbereus TaxID=65552 RepID=UPI003EECF9C6
MSKRVSFARILLKNRGEYALLPSKVDPRKHRWQKRRSESARTTKPSGFGSVALPGWERRLPERFVFEQFGDLREGNRGREGPVLIGELADSGERWILKPTNEGAVSREIIASVIGRSLGLNVPPAAVVEQGKKLMAASMLVPELRHAAPFSSRNPLHFGPDGPENVPNYWQQVALGDLLGDIDRKGGNWGVTPDGRRWDFDFSLSQEAYNFLGPDEPGWNRMRLKHMKQNLERKRQAVSPEAFQRYLEPYRTLAENDPEKLYGWLGGVSDLGVILIVGGSLRDTLIASGRANREAARLALNEVGV